MKTKNSELSGEFAGNRFQEGDDQYQSSVESLEDEPQSSVDDSEAGPLKPWMRLWLMLCDIVHREIVSFDRYRKRCSRKDYRCRLGRCGAISKIAKALFPESFVRMCVSTPNEIQRLLYVDRSRSVQTKVRLLHASHHLIGAVQSTAELCFWSQLWPESTDGRVRNTVTVMKVLFDVGRTIQLFDSNERRPSDSPHNDLDCLYHRLCAVLLLLKMQYFFSIVFYEAEFVGLELILLLEKVMLFHDLLPALRFRWEHRIPR